MSGASPYELLTFASSSVAAALGALLLGLRIPGGQALGTLRTARGYLALSYFIWAAAGLASTFLHPDVGDKPADQILILTIASCQALLFTMTLVVFIQPLHVRRKTVVRQLAGIAAASLALFAALHLSPGMFFPWLFRLAIAAYLILLAAYTCLFRRKYALTVRQTEAYYDEEQEARLRWVKVCFYSALGIGLMVPGLLFFYRETYDTCLVVFTAYYVCMTGRFYNYTSSTGFIIPAVTGQGGGKSGRFEMPWPIPCECPGTAL